MSNKLKRTPKNKNKNKNVVVTKMQKRTLMAFAFGNY